MVVPLDLAACEKWKHDLIFYNFFAARLFTFSESNQSFYTQYHLNCDWKGDENKIFVLMNPHYGPIQYRDGSNFKHWEFTVVIIGFREKLFLYNLYNYTGCFKTCLCYTVAPFNTHSIAKSYSNVYFYDKNSSKSFYLFYKKIFCIKVAGFNAYMHPM